MSQDTIELRCELAGLRMTEQRRLIARVLQEATDHPDVEQVYSRAIKFDPAISIATVYRTLNLLVECELVEANSFQSGKKTYERMFHVRHHDHLICTSCEKTIEFEHPLIEKYQVEICEAYGFSLKSHKMELLGICNNCRVKNTSPLSFN